MRSFLFATIVLGVFFVPASGRADVNLRGPLYNPTEYAKVEAFVGGFILFDRSPSLREAGFLEGGVAVQKRPRGILILGADLLLQLGIDNFQFAATTRRTDFSRLDTRRWDFQQDPVRDVIEAGPVSSMDSESSEPRSARGLHAAAGGRIHIGASLGWFDVTAFLGARVAAGIVNVPGVGVRALGDFKLDVGLQAAINLHRIRVRCRISFGVFEKHLSASFFQTGTRMGAPSGGAPPLDVDSAGAPISRDQRTTGATTWFLESVGIRREDRFDVMLGCDIAWPRTEPEAEPYPHHAESYESEASRPATAAPAASTPVAVAVAPAPIAPPLASAPKAAPEPASPSQSNTPAPPVAPAPAKKKSHRTTRVPAPRPAPPTVAIAPMPSRPAPTPPEPAPEPPSRTISTLANRLERALAAADTALVEVEQEDPSRLRRAGDVWLGKPVETADIFKQFRREGQHLLATYRDALSRARALAQAADAASSEAERKRLLHASTVLLLATLGYAELALYLIEAAVVVSYGQKDASSQGIALQFGEQAWFDYNTRISALGAASSDVELLRELDEIDKNRTHYGPVFDFMLAKMKVGSERARKVILSLNIASLALSLYQVARIPVAPPSGGAPPSLVPAFASAGGAVAAGQVSPAALAETVEAIKKLVALGALDPAVTTMGTSPALPSNKPALPKLEPLRQDALPTDATGGTATAPASAPAVQSKPLEPRPVRELTLRPDNVAKAVAAGQKRYGWSPDQIKAIERVAKRKNEKWILPQGLRGQVSHVLRGENLRPGFQAADRVDAIHPQTRVAGSITSFKSHQFYAKSMRTPGGTFATIKKDVDAIASFKPGEKNGGPGVGRFWITADTKRILQVEVPPRTLRHIAGETAAEAGLRAQFIRECEQARAYAASQGIELEFVEAGR